MLELAKHVSSWSKDPSTQVGAVITFGKKVLSVGYNGFPADVEDKPEWYSDRDKKLSLIEHAEINAWKTINETWLWKCTLYTYPYLPCSRCAEEFSKSGISRVVSLKNTEPRWEDSINDGKKILSAKGVSVDDTYLEDVYYYVIRKIQS
jgi:dCMP deaminase